MQLSVKACYHVSVTVRRYRHRRDKSIYLCIYFKIEKRAIHNDKMQHAKKYTFLEPVRRAKAMALTLLQT